MVVPSAEDPELGREILQIDLNALAKEAPARLERPEESLDPPVLPRRQFLDALMLDVQNSQTQAEEPRGEDGLVVGSELRGLAELADGMDQLPEDYEGVFDSRCWSAMQARVPWSMITRAISDESARP